MPGKTKLCMFMIAAVLGVAIGGAAWALFPAPMIGKATDTAAEDSPYTPIYAQISLENKFFNFTMEGETADFFGHTIHKEDLLHFTHDIPKNPEVKTYYRTIGWSISRISNRAGYPETAVTESELIPGWDWPSGHRIPPDECHDAFKHNALDMRKSIAWMHYKHNDSQETDDGLSTQWLQPGLFGNQAGCVWVFRKETLEEGMKNQALDPAWWNALQKQESNAEKNKGKCYWFYAGMDAEVTYYANNVPQGWRVTQKMINGNPPTGMQKNDIPPGTVGYVYDYQDYEQGRDFVSVLSNSNGSVKQRFGCIAEWKFVKYGKKKKPKAKPVTQSYKIVKGDTGSNTSDDRYSWGSSDGGNDRNSGKSALGRPQVATFNLSDKNSEWYDKHHNIGTAIPADEDFTTGVEDSSWFGHVGHNYTSGVIDDDITQFTVTGEASYTWTDSDGKSHDETVYETYDSDENYYYNFFWQNDANLWQLNRGTAKNGTYGQAYFTGKPGEVSASGSEHISEAEDPSGTGMTAEIPFLVTVDKKAYITGDKAGKDELLSGRDFSSSEAIKEYHVQYDKADWGDFSVSAGDGYSSSGAARIAARAAAENAAHERETKNQGIIYENTHNDICVLNNVTYIADHDSYVSINGKRMKEGQMVDAGSGYPKYGNTKNGKNDEYWIPTNEIEKYSGLYENMLPNKTGDLEKWLISEDIEEENGGITDDAEDMADEYSDMFEDTDGRWPDRCVAAAHVHIPVERKNGKYYSAAEAEYVPFMKAMDQASHTFAVEDYFSGPDSPSVKKEAIRPGDIGDADGEEFDDDVSSWTDNEPVIVHSPAISPLVLKEGQNRTQLVKEPQPGLPQLILDNAYRMEWDWDGYFEDEYGEGYEMPVGLTEHVVKKDVRFPFPVLINGVYYEADRDMNGTKVDTNGRFTPWITVWHKDTEGTENGMYAPLSGTDADYTEGKTMPKFLINLYKMPIPFIFSA